jgi:hypothetical protein
MEGEGKFVREGSLYPCKIPSNFHGCTMTVSTHRKGGIEVELHSLYFLTHNITWNYNNNFPDDATLLEKAVKCLLNLWFRESDLSFGGFLLIEEAVYSAEYTSPYYFTKFNWFVPCPKPFSRLQRISRIFSPSVWAAIVVVLFLVTVTSCCLAKQSNDIRSYTTMSSALYNIWAVTVGVSVIGKPRSFRLMFLFVVFVLYCSAISTTFQTFLTGFLVDPGYENQLMSLDEILDSGIEFGYPNFFRVFFTESSDLRHKEVVAEGKICLSEWECLDKIRETGNFAAFVPAWAVHSYKTYFKDCSTICSVNDDDYAFGFTTTYVQKGSIFLDSLNKFIALSFESGIIDRALRDTLLVSKPIRNTTDLSDGYFVFTFSHLRIAFYILLCGHGLSFLLFLCEVFCHFRLRYV